MNERRFGYIYIIIDFKTVVPFRRPRYRTSHCYSELSGDYWDKLSHPTITDIFAGIHAQTQAAGKGIRYSSYIDYLKLYIANLYRPAFVSAYI